MSAVHLVRDKPQGALALLCSRRFGPLCAAQFLPAFSDNALRNALVLMIAYRTAATRHGAAAVAVLRVAVALAAWPASWGIPRTTPAAQRSGTCWNLMATTAHVVRQAATEPVPSRSMLGISWFWLAARSISRNFPVTSALFSARRNQS